MSIGPQRPSSGGGGSSQDPRLDALMQSMPVNELFVKNSQSQIQGIGFKIPDMEVANTVTGVDSSGKWKAFTLSPLAQQMISFNSESMVKGLLGIEVPTKLSELQNDSGYVKQSELPAMQGQVNSDWNSVNGVSQVLNKPNLSAVALSGDYSDLANKPIIPTVNYPVSSVNSKTGAVNLTASDVGAIATGSQIPYSSLTGTPNIPAAQVNSDWNSTTGLSQILKKPVLFSGSYTDLTNKPVLFDGTYASLTGKPTTFTPSAHTHVIGDVSGLQNALDGKISIGASIPYATITGAPVVPTNTNQLTNGSGYITASQVVTASPVQSVNGQTGAVTLTIPASQIQSDWNQTVTTALDYIKNKPSIPSVSVTSVNAKTGAVVLSASDVGAIAVGANIPYSTLTGVPSIPAAQVQTDWNAVSGLGLLMNKPSTFTPSAHTQSWSTITATPTTLAGYGITDAVSSANLPNYRRADNSVVAAPIKVKYYTATSDANSVWTVSLGTDFTEVLDVQVTAVSVANTVAGVRQASLNAYTSTSTSLSGVTSGNNVLSTLLVSAGANTLALIPSTAVRVTLTGK